MAFVGGPMRQLVPSPAFVPRQYGLMSVVTDVTPPETEDQHWQNGVTWQDICGLGGSTFQEPCEGTPEPDDKAVNIDVATYGATPFTPFVEVDCPPVGYSREEQLARGSEALNRTEAYQIERAFWTGNAGGETGRDIVYPHLAADSAVEDTSHWPAVLMQCAASPVSGSIPLDIVEGLGKLEAAFAACYTGQGVIHVPSVLGSDLFARFLVKAESGVLRTGLGNKVAVGAGYTGSGPNGVVTPNVAWIYMTGPINMYRARAVTFRYDQMFDRSNNTLYDIVERTVLLHYTCCCMVAVPISTGGVVTGAPLSAFQE